MLSIKSSRLHHDDDKQSNRTHIESQKMQLAKPVAFYPLDPKTRKPVFKPQYQTDDEVANQAGAYEMVKLKKMIDHFEDLASAERIHQLKMSLGRLVEVKKDRVGESRALRQAKEEYETRINQQIETRINQQI
jgi:hypothetical protein